MKRFLLGLAAVCGGALALGAQTRVTIVDAVTGEAVPYAHVLWGAGAAAGPAEPGPGAPQGRYADEAGAVEIPAGVETFAVSHISYERTPARLADGAVVRMQPVVAVLAPAVVVPRGRRTQRLGHAYDKRVATYGCKSAMSVAELIVFPEGADQLPLIEAVSLNLNTVNLKREMTVTVADRHYTDGKTHVAKLRVDLREVDPATGAPGASLTGGGVIYALPDRFNLDVHKVHRVALPAPVAFPEEGVFVVVEWIVTADVREQDSVCPTLWRCEGGATSWLQWPLGGPWEPVAAPRSFCLGLEVR